jgi:EAL domain-containing protein (putative c-di-GMP-specific phosphodiesterase class I)
VPPMEFIPVAEETGLIGPLGAWVLEEACATAQRWRMDHPELRGMVLAVNLSSRQLTQSDLVPTVERILESSGFPASLLCLEITESVLMNDAEDTTRVLTDLKRLGVRLAVDDFGTGYSSLSYLTRFPIDVLKVDRSFVANLSEQADSWSIVAAVIGLSRSLGLSTVAEGVEDEAQASILRSLGCELAQGYHYARPQPAEDVEALLLAPPRAATDLYVQTA